mmetsp:Transcript_18692/g.40057  ORF Transcript_18692/g.40057 Transcript_18692/m.40057 type:complete len:279 (-) Transcript_18692:513-1349(-)
MIRAALLMLMMGTGATQNTTENTTSVTTFKLLEWNVYWQNRDVWGLAGLIMVNNPQPDIIGLCELTTPMQEMAAALTGVAKRPYAAQPGRDAWQGYGTDIFYDTTRWEALEGGVARAPCSSWGGPRAGNWVVLRERSTSELLITGGTHLSACNGGCPELNQCELRNVYSHFDAMKAKYPTARVAWMGDLNQVKTTPMLAGAFEGDLGNYYTFLLEDVSLTDRNTHMNGGAPIDFIFAERGSFVVKDHGSTGQGVTGHRLNGADHFPIFSILTFAASDQ